MQHDGCHTPIGTSHRLIGQCSDVRAKRMDVRVLDWDVQHLFKIRRLVVHLTEYGQDKVASRAFSDGIAAHVHGFTRYFGQHALDESTHPLPIQ